MNLNQLLYLHINIKNWFSLYFVVQAFKVFRKLPRKRKTVCYLVSRSVDVHISKMFNLNDLNLKTSLIKICYPKTKQKMENYLSSYKKHLYYNY